METPKMAFDMVLTCWDCTSKYRSYIRSLGDNLSALESSMNELYSVSIDVRRVLDMAEGEGWVRKDDTAQWLTRVADLRKEVNNLVEDGKKMMENSCLRGLCFINCCARYYQSKHADERKADLAIELGRGRGFKVREDVAYEPSDLIIKKSLMALRKKKDELDDFSRRVKREIRRDEKRHRSPIPEVAGSLKEVEDLLGEVSEILDQGKDAKMGEESHHITGAQTERKYSVSRQADDKIVELDGKIIEGRGFGVLTELDDPLIVEIPQEPTVGAESMFKEVWDWVEDETVKCIGLVGMGGVGKTTPLCRIHNQFLKVAHNYDFILWTVVSGPVNLDKIQVAIFKKLKVPKDDWEDLDRRQRAGRIQLLMKDMNFLLFLDDLSDPINLLEDVGIPCPDNPKKYKIIFTTRDERVCNGMKADKTKRVGCLPPDEALQLFHRNLGEKTWSAHPGIPKIAERLVDECKHLPLAVKTVARAMAGKTELKHWVKAEEDLKKRLSKFQDLEKEVLGKLEFSYDRLPDETHKMCFLYLSIFPEDREMLENDVIDLWIGEGFLDDNNDVREARIEGEKIIKNLVDSCLLEFKRRVPLHGRIVKMHDMVREMALWVYMDHGQKKNRVLVQDGMKSFGLQELKKWQHAEKISLWKVRGELRYSSSTVPCSRLSTLVMRETSLNGLYGSFSSSLRLRFLDLTDVEVDDLPSNIWSLTTLRYLKITRRYYGGWVKVPVKIGNLSKLEVLILSRCFVLPVGVLSNLSSLRVFHYLDVQFSFTSRVQSSSPSTYRSTKLVEVLQMMQSIEEVSISLHSIKSVKKLSACDKLPSHLRQLHLCDCGGEGLFSISTSLLRKLENLQVLCLLNMTIRQIDVSHDYEGSEGSWETGRSHGEPLAPKPSRLSSLYGFHDLGEVVISGCSNLVDVTSLIYHTPALEALYIGYCPLLEEVISGDIEDDHETTHKLFPCLEYLWLESLDRLKRICRKALPFPSLKEINVRDCRELNELPLDSHSARKSLQAIRGRQRWWAGLQWDDPASEKIFFAKFVE